MSVVLRMLRHDELDVIRKQFEQEYEKFLEAMVPIHCMVVDVEETPA